MVTVLPTKPCMVPKSDKDQIVMWGAARRNKLNWCSAHILLFNKVGEHGGLGVGFLSTLATVAGSQPGLY